MIIRIVARIALASTVVALVGCGQDRSAGPPTKTAPPDQTPAPAQGPASPVAVADPTGLPEFGPTQLIKPGIKFREATLERGGVPMRVWFYEPEKAADPLALVL